jgi:hypothetical protein
MKLAKIEIYRWPRYGVMNMLNITVMCRFLKRVANWDRWPTSKGGQLDRFYCIIVLFYF